LLAAVAAEGGTCFGSVCLLTLNLIRIRYLSLHEPFLRFVCCWLCVIVDVW
jgi:hypothetical protein